MADYSKKLTSHNKTNLAIQKTALLILETSRRGIYAIGGSISPSYMEIHEDRTIREKKHSNLIYTAVRDGVIAMNGIVSGSEKG